MTWAKKGRRRVTQPHGVLKDKHIRYRIEGIPHFLEKKTTQKEKKAFRSRGRGTGRGLSL